MCLYAMQEMQGLLEPDEEAEGAAVVKFSSPDIARVLDVKEYYCQLAENLQVQCSIKIQ